LDCVDMAIRKKRLSYALGVKMTQEEFAGFREEYSKVISNAEVGE